MKNNRHHSHTPKDTPATRKRRLQMRLQEISDRSEKEIASLMKSVEKVKSSIRTKKSK